MNMVTANGPGGGKYDRIADTFLFNHLLNPRQQIRVVLEPRVLPGAQIAAAPRLVMLRIGAGRAGRHGLRGDGDGGRPSAERVWRRGDGNLGTA